MAIVTEYYKTREDGVVLNRAYSDKGMKIEREGVRYEEAIDPVELNRQYIETDEPVGDNTDEATVEGYEAVTATEV
jgi:hypothetical protein